MINYNDNYLKSFKELYSFEKRKTYAEQIKAKYPSRIPIICEKNRFSKNSPDIDKKKYLVPYNLNLGQFIYQIRKRLNLNPEVALFFFTGGFISSHSQFISNLYSQYKDEDGFLYIYYAVENTFGNNFDLRENDNIYLIKNNITDKSINYIIRKIEIIHGGNWHDGFDISHYACLENTETKIIEKHCILHTNYMCNIYSKYFEKI
jgi:GABA(A) receptor-associated protein